MEKINPTKHLLEDRMDRVVFIATTIGFGEVVDEFIVEDKKRGQRCECVTSTGVIIVKGMDRKTVITMFIGTVKQLAWLYHGERNIPLSVLKVAKRNEKKRLMEKSEGK